MQRLHHPHTWLGIILAGFILLATIYSLVTPLFEASDELWHYPMVKYIADHDFGLPVQNPATAEQTAWRQEGGQPPLYYMIGAAATFWIDTSDLSTVRRINVHADIGTVVPDGNANMVVHREDRESFPWSGTALAMHIVRFLSILMGAGTVLLIYLLGIELFPKRPSIALAAAAFTAFNPMFLFISAVINNDNLSTLLATLILWLLVRLIKSTDPTPIRFYVTLGLAAGAGMLAKFQIGFLLPLIALALLIDSIRRRDWRPVILGGLISGGLTILIAGWWYWRNTNLYGDATGINVFLDIVGRRAIPADWQQLWSEREVFMMSYWGLFGGVNVPMADAVYTVFNVIVAISLIGLVVGMVWSFVSPHPRPLSLRRGEKNGKRGFLSPSPGGGRTEFGRDYRVRAARAMTLLWAVIVFVSLITWTRQTWATQGRLWFSAMAPLSLWMAAGLASFHPARQWRISILSAVSAWFVFVALIVPFATIRPAYTLDRDAYWDSDTLESEDILSACFTPPDSNAELCMAYHQLTGSIQPGQYARFAPTFTLKGHLNRDWSIFVHFVNEDGLIEFQRDVYPSGGLIATSDLDDGSAWNNLIAVRVPQGIYTPQKLNVYLGLYHLPTYDRMIPVGSAADTENNRILLGQITLETPEGSVPNPVDVNFDDEIQLLGYEITDRSLAPGESTELTLYWQARQDLDREYVISFQVIDPDTLTKAAQDDRPPELSTLEWDSGDTITDTRTITIYPDAGAGRYRVMVRVYPADDPAHPLRIRAGTGGQSEDFVWLNWMQVEE